MKKILPTLVVVILIGITFYWVFFIPTKNDVFYNTQVCVTKNMEIAGVISGFGGHGIYQWIQIDNLNKSISISIVDTKFKKGFSENYYYQIGDSLIKEKNSKEFMIKKDANIALYTLNCKD